MASSSSNILNIPLHFSVAPTSENKHFHFDVNQNDEQETNVNDYLYFYSEDGVFPVDDPQRQIVHVVDLRKIVAKSTEEQHRMKKMMMVNQDGEIFPAHLPNIFDVVMKPQVRDAIRQLVRNGSIIEYHGRTYVIPVALVNMMDPKPVLPRSGPIYMLTHSGFDADFGCCTDKVQFVKVAKDITRFGFCFYRDQFMENDPSTRYHALKIRVDNVGGKKCFDLGASIVLWNVRRITRPSFVAHFREVVATHNPVLVILMEIGAGPTNCLRVLEKLGTTMCWRVDSGGGMLGGTVVMWDPTRVVSTAYVADCPRPDLRVVATVTSVGS